MSKRRLLLIVQAVFYGALIWFVVQRFDKLVASIDLGILLERPLHVAASIIFFLLFYGLLAVHWKLVCDKYEKYPQDQQWLSFFASQPYKYLPSSVFTFSSRAVYAKKLGLPMKQSSAVQLIENFNILGSAFCTAILFLLFNTAPVLGAVASVLLLAALIGITFIPAVKLPKTALSISGRYYVRLLLLALAAWLSAGVAFYFIILATGSGISFVSAVAANAIAVGLGIVAVFAPGGIGVREFIYNKFSIGTTAIVLWRLLTLVVDLAVGLTAIYLIKRKSAQKS